MAVADENAGRNVRHSVVDDVRVDHADVLELRAAGAAEQAYANTGSTGTIGAVLHGKALDDIAVSIELTGEGLVEIHADRRPCFAGQVDVRGEIILAGQVVADRGQLFFGGNRRPAFPVRFCRQSCRAEPGSQDSADQKAK